ncbi:hypothetical protein HLA87_02455 [Mycoplasma miroungigenitalium]|uniref:Uncharacterized protein n=1 Tax=Mycoplasma miroungigenitalium TaxID=754515 RepID=A0A6M4JC88_9MOLU|nr:hypothetical protein [Mycoplasma miroungigenitalium]QJR43636.1 hypothetical protein HLA87_02455 [Mycoplasma miroungigenitalium]
MARFNLKDLENWNEPDVFIIDDALSFNLDTTAHSIFKLQQFINKYGDFNNSTKSLNTQADKDFLNIMLKPADVDKFIKSVNRKYKAMHVTQIVHQMFQFWFSQATGQDLNQLEQLQETTKKHQVQ